MSQAQLRAAAGPTRLAGQLRRRLQHPATLAGLALGLGLILLLLAALEGNLSYALGDWRLFLQGLVLKYGQAVPFGLLYLEESGVPMPVPGDVFVMYVGHHAPHTLLALSAAWVALTAVVVLGASNLYFVSRRWGRKLVERRLGRILHLTPARLERAERWFARRGLWALIFGRHIPGFRVPLTVAAGIFKVRYPVFVLSVAVSTATWSAIFLWLGIALGGRIVNLVRLHGQGAMVFVAAVVVLGGAYIVFRILASASLDERGTSYPAAN